MNFERSRRLKVGGRIPLNVYFCHALAFAKVAEGKAECGLPLQLFV